MLCSATRRVSGRSCVGTITETAGVAAVDGDRVAAFAAASADGPAAAGRGGTVLGCGAVRAAGGVTGACQGMERGGTAEAREGSDATGAGPATVRADGDA